LGRPPCRAAARHPLPSVHHCFLKLACIRTLHPTPLPPRPTFFPTVTLFLPTPPSSLLLLSPRPYIAARPDGRPRTICCRPLSLRLAWLLPSPFIVMPDMSRAPPLSWQPHPCQHTIVQLSPSTRSLGCQPFGPPHLTDDAMQQPDCLSRFVCTTCKHQHPRVWPWALRGQGTTQPAVGLCLWCSAPVWPGSAMIERAGGMARETRSAVPACSGRLGGPLPGTATAMHLKGLRVGSSPATLWHV